MNTGKIGIIDYGCGNLFNIEKVLKHIKVRDFIRVKQPDIVEKCEKIILPGVGAFKTGMKNIEEKNLSVALSNHVKRGKHLLGICMGMQLLMSSSEEFGYCEGLSFIEGKIVNLRKIVKKENCLVPHIGWAKSICQESEKIKDEPFVDIIRFINNKDFYFNHSYALSMENIGSGHFYSTYYGEKFGSVVFNKNVIGVQFHPELSGKLGIELIKKFILI